MRLLAGGITLSIMLMAATIFAGQEGKEGAAVVAAEARYHVC
ncbi:MAG: hypothetical protein WAL90_19390 [Desulfobacterales bacterium]